MSQPLYCQRPFKLTDRLVKNINSWGNVEYNIPIREDNTETRTSFSVGHRYIPDISFRFDVADKAPLPQRVIGRDRGVQEDTFRTSNCVYAATSQKQASAKKPTEDYGRPMTCTEVHFMKFSDDKFRMDPPRLGRIATSEMKDNFLGRPLLEPPQERIESPDPHAFRDVFLWSRREGPVIPAHARGYRRLLDPYLTTNLECHKPFTRDDQLGIGRKDNITFYTENPTIKPCWGFGPKEREVWMPLMARRKRPVEDKLQFKKEYVGVSRGKMDDWVPSAFKTETMERFDSPHAQSEIAHRQHELEGLTFGAEGLQPSPQQTMLAPAMYSTEYRHYGRRLPVCAAVDQQDARKAIVHQPCEGRHVVSRRPPQ